jgi:hypothetical protein
MAVEVAPFLEGKKKFTIGLLTPFVATAVAAIFMKLGEPAKDAVEHAITITLTTGGAYLGLEFLRDMLRDWRQGRQS